MAISPIDYTGGNGFAQGVGLAGLYQETKQRQALAEQQQQQLEAEKAFQADWNEAWNSGDQRKIMDLTGKYPSQMKTIRDGIGIRDEQHQKAVNDMANDLAVARQVGTPQAIAQAISKHQDTLKGIATPEETMQMALSNPAGFDNLVNAVRLSTMPADKQFDVQDKKEGRAIERAKLTEDARQADMANARGWAGVNIQQQNANLARERFNFDKEIRIAETKDKVLSKQLAAETDALKKEELTQKIAANKENLEAAKSERYDGFINQMESADRSIKMANDILKSDGFNDFFGTNINPFSNHRIPGTSGADTASMVDTLKSQAFMAGVQQMRGMGALSDAEGKKITDSIGNLSPSMSEAQAKKSIDNIISTLKQGQERAIKKNPDEYKRYQSESTSSGQQGQQSAQSYSEGMTATNPSTGQKMIFRGGKWQQM